MAEEQVEAPKKSPLMRYAMTGGMVVLVPMILALVLCQFVLRPLLAPAEGAEHDAHEEEHHAVEGVFPEGSMPIEFPEAQAAVLPDEPQLAAPILLYRVAMVCADEHSHHLIEYNMVYFTAMLDKLHRNRTRMELNDPQVQETILKQARQEANTLLKRLDPKGHGEVLEAMYVKFGLIDI